MPSLLVATVVLPSPRVSSFQSAVLPLLPSRPAAAPTLSTRSPGSFYVFVLLRIVLDMQSYRVVFVCRLFFWAVVLLVQIFVACGANDLADGTTSFHNEGRYKK